MGFERRKINYLLITLAGMLLLLFIDYLGGFEGVNAFLFDLSFRIRGPRPTDSRLVVVAIDETTLAKMGKWPIRRTYYADLLDRTRKAAVVGFDIIIAEPSDDDRVFAEAIRRHGRVVLPAYVSADRSALVYPAGELSPAAIGHVHVEQDIDGIVRRIFHTLYRDADTIPSLASVIYEMASGTGYDRRPLSPEHRGQLATGAIFQADPAGINYYGGPRSFSYIPFADIVAGTYPPHFFKDKVVLVGVAAAGLVDSVLTPFSQERTRMAAVELQATVVNNLLAGDDLREFPAWATRLLAVILFGLCFALLMQTGDRSAFAVWLLSLLLVTGLTFGSFSLLNLWGGPALPCASATFACVLPHLFRLDQMAVKLDREYSGIASRLGWDTAGSGNLVPQRGIAGFISTKGINEKIEMLVRVAEELLKTYQELETETAERVRAMGELRQKEQMLIQQSRMAAMGEMLNNIAHQWRQPLNAMGLTIQQLGLFFESGQLSKELLDSKIAKTMEILLHLSQTIDDFRNFSLPDKEKRVFKVEQVLAKTISIIEESFKNQNVTIETGAIGEPQINGYPNEFGQVILNILMNARDAHLERKTSEARVTVRSWTENGKAVVSITDNAGGIEEEVMGKIFDAYFTTKELGKGTGVGLFMSKTIIEKNMGGRLTARNTGNGVEFRIEVESAGLREFERDRG